MFGPGGLRVDIGRVIYVLYESLFDVMPIRRSVRQSVKLHTMCEIHVLKSVKKITH